MSDDRPIERFVVLGSARTGSNYLLSLLSAHPAIKVYGELFNLDKLPEPSLLEALDDPLAYLRKRLYAPHPPHIAAVGFKMFYYHLKPAYFEKLIDPSEASDGLRTKFERFYHFIESKYDWATLYARFEATWDALIADRSVKVLHLKRRNLLHTLISHKTAFATGQWMRVASREQPKTTIHLDPEECQRYFDRLAGFAADADAAFADHARLDVTYEGLVHAQAEELERIFGFLTLPGAPVKTLMKKQILAPASEVVDNYGQLREHFKDTRWHAFFDA
jgi:LPS sulfotransferase NodH